MPYTSYSYAQVLEARATNTNPVRQNAIPGRLPAQPFIAWLRASYKGDQVYPDFAFCLGVSERTLRSLVEGKQASVDSKLVDRCLTSADWIVEVDGRPIFDMDDLYPKIAYRETE